MRSALILIILVTFSSSALAQTKVPTTQPASKSASKTASGDIIAHGNFDAFLKKHVSETGDVDYAGIKNSPEAMTALDAYLSEIGGATIDKKDNSDGALAFYINAYNAYAVSYTHLTLPTTPYV